MKQQTVIVTGGCGYIGVHTVVDLIDAGFDVISIDNNVRSDAHILEGVRQITGRQVKNYPVDLRDLNATEKVFAAHSGIAGVIHFAAFKTVPESVAHPLRYYDNNLNALINILTCTAKHEVPHFVFSSSCSVYGDTKALPVDEATPVQKQASPYGTTKRMGEIIIEDYTKVHATNCLSLRYFNPVGAHETGLIGEVPYDEPENLLPIIIEAATGKRKQLTVYGNDYDTRDGTCIRDYIHVMDIAHAHTKALQYLLDGKNKSNYEIFNLGTGKGVSVLEAIHAFEKVTGQKFRYTIGDRRPGDVAAIYADNRKARTQLGWEPSRTIEDMMSSAWKWEQHRHA